MNTWTENQWWFSEDPRERAYYQTKEPVLLMPFNKYHADVEILLSRPVFTHEFTSPKLPEEAERAWKYGVGCTSEKERQERQRDAIKSLQKIAQESGKDIIVIDTQQ